MAQNHSSNTPQKKPHYQWTIMVYLSGDNNLGPEMIWAINEIGGISSDLRKRVAITVQYDARASEHGSIRYAFTRDQRQPVAPSHLPQAAAQVRGRFSENSANPEVLAEFIRWSIREYPSTYRMLVLSGHGSGVVGDFLPDSEAKKKQPRSLTIPRLAQAFNLAKQRLLEDATKRTSDARLQKLRSANWPLLHILGMDSCLMSMLEVCYEVRKHTRYLVGSEGFMPTTGWPYGHLLQALAESKGKLPNDDAMADQIVDNYLGYYQDHVVAGVSVDIAACNLGHLDPVTAALRELIDKLPPSGVSDVDVRRLWDFVVLAHWRSQSYKFEQYTDLWDFCSELKKTIGLHAQAAEKEAAFKEIEDACEGVKVAIDGAIARRSFHGPAYQHSHGVSVYFPWNGSSSEIESILNPYCELQFEKECDEQRKKQLNNQGAPQGQEQGAQGGWGSFLKRYLNETMRKPIRVPANGGQLVGRSAASTPIHRYSPEFNKFSPEFNRNLIYTFGERAPGSMKNPPQGVCPLGEGNARISQGHARSTKVQAQEGGDQTEQQLVMQ